MLPSLKRPRRFIPLLVTLVALFVAYPVAVELGLQRFLRLFSMMMLLGAVYAVSGDRHTLRAAAALALPVLVAQVAAMALPGVVTSLVALVLSLAFMAFAIVSVARVVLTARRVDDDTIAGAVCLYLFLGLAWAMLYALIGAFEADAFRVPASMVVAHDAGPRTEYSHVYFSFVTLTTLGYGDITPVTPIAHTAAWLEAVAGQLFIGILIGRLVSLHIEHGLEESATA